ncbi:hypothetical protein MferCBS31731_001398 [Microsporum ferrugineum]
MKPALTILNMFDSGMVHDIQGLSQSSDGCHQSYHDVHQDFGGFKIHFEPATEALQKNILPSYRETRSLMPWPSPPFVEWFYV